MTGSSMSYRQSNDMDKIGDSLENSIEPLTKFNLILSYFRTQLNHAHFTRGVNTDLTCAPVGYSIEMS